MASELRIRAAVSRDVTGQRKPFVWSPYGGRHTASPLRTMMTQTPPQPGPHPSPPPSSRSDTNSRRWTLLEKFLAIVGALLALGTAYLGYQTAQMTQAKEQAQAAAASKGAEASALQDQNGQLQDQNNKLRSQLGGPTAPPRTPTGPSVRHAGQLTLAAVSGGGADLDSPPSDPQWGGSADLNSDGDLAYGGRNVDFGFYSEVLFMKSAKADYDSCSTTTGYGSGHDSTIAVADFPIGSYICLKTNEKRYSAIRLIAVDASKATFDVVTYDPPVRN